MNKALLQKYTWSFHGVNRRAVRSKSALGQWRQDNVKHGLMEAQDFYGRVLK